MTDILCTNNIINKNLMSLDPLLSKLIKICGHIEIKLSNNYFESLVSSIVGQQLSNKVANIIWNRMLVLLNEEFSSEKILKTNDEDFRKIGVSYSKIGYIKNLSRRLIDKEICLDSLCSMNNKKVIASLTAIKGIGNWTAEMFLIFSLGRTDVFSLSDGGLRRSIKWLYGLDGPLNNANLLEISGKWKPYRSYASLYLWQAINRNLINTI